MADWDASPFIRVYLTLGRDHPKVWRDLRVLGGYVRALAVAERAYPAPFELTGLPEDVIGALVADGVIEQDPDDAGWWLFHGLVTERNLQATRMAWHRAGGRARAASAPRDPAGRLLGQQPAGVAGLQQPAGTAGHRNGATPASSLLDAPAGNQQPSNTDTDTVDVDAALRAATSTSLLDQQNQQPAGSPKAAAGYVCRDPEGHDSPPRFTPGVGWWCPDCATEDARADDESFRAKARRHGAADA